MKDKKDMIKKAFYLSGIIIMTLFFIKISSVSSYANEVHNKQANDEKRITNRLWCKEHGVYEDECFICHPELEPKNSENYSPDRLWCNEHSVYEDECFICNPELASKNSEDVSKGLYCEEHRVPEKECGICHPELTTLLKPGNGLKVRLESKDSAAKAGIVVSVLEYGSPFADFVVLCRVNYNLNFLARITPLTSGVIRKVLVNVGAYVSQDDVLVEIVSPEIAKAKAEYLTALADKTLKKLVYEREKGLFEKKISSQHEYQQALAEYQMAVNTTNTKRQQLLNYGFTEAEVQKIVETQSSSSLLPIRAPFSGTLIERNAVVGEVIGSGDILFSLADLTTMWLELSIPEERLSFFKIGNLIEASFNSLPNQKLHGELIWLASNIEEQSRMIKARAIVKNLDSQLRHGMFGQVSLLPEQSNEALYVPADSIQRFDKKSFVFVMRSEDLYEIRMVATGSRNDSKVVILEGLLPHEKIVTSGSFTLKSEFLKSRLGEGCVDE